jgi:hypothetical protein
MHGVADLSVANFFGPDVIEQPDNQTKPNAAKKNGMKFLPRMNGYLIVTGTGTGSIPNLHPKPRHRFDGYAGGAISIGRTSVPHS